MKRFLWVGTRIHVWLYWATGGKVGGRVGGVPSLLLTTRGRRSAKERTTPASYLEEGDRILIASANVGSDKHPGWFWNLKATPKVHIERLGNRFPAVARVAEGEERDRLWSHLNAQLPALATYQTKTHRTIPVVVITPPNPDRLQELPSGSRLGEQLPSASRPLTRLPPPGRDRTATT